MLKREVVKNHAKVATIGKQKVGDVRKGLSALSISQRLRGAQKRFSDPESERRLEILKAAHS
jgi:hypothetical protein